MKKILFSLFLILILTSCSKQKKEAALENCADSYFLGSKDRLYSIETNYKEDPIYKSIEEALNDLKNSSLSLSDERMLLHRKFKKEHPKPWDKGSGFKSPKMSDPKYFQKNTKLVDFKLYDEAKAKYEKKEGEYEKIYREKLREWKYEERVYFSNVNKKRVSLEKKIKETQYELPRRIYSLVDKKFILLTLKDKSNIELYIDIYTGCEKLYNKTPSAFLLEWHNN